MRDSVILVTGGAGGIGAETCGRLASHGARVVIADLVQDRAESQAANINAAGGQATAVVCDITQPDSCDRAAEIATEHFGRLDAMVNCAGVSKPHDSLTLPPADWAGMVDIQLNGAFYIAQACAKRMNASGG